MAVAHKPTQPPHKARGDDHAAIHRQTSLGWVDAAVALALSGVLMLLGGQWYILFKVVAGAMGRADREQVLELIVL